MWPGAAITVPLPHATQKMSYAIEVSQQVPEDLLLLGSAHSSYTTSSSLGLCSATGRAQDRQEIPWLTRMWGENGKSWS